MDSHETATDEAAVAAARAAAERDGRLDAMQKILVAGAASRVPAIARGLRALLGGVSFEECESAGYEALVRAALRYDPATGVPFMAFAYQRVRGAMLDAARDASPDRRRLARMIRLTEAAASLTEASAPLAGDPRTLAERVEEAEAIIREVTTAVVLARAADDLGDPGGVDLETRLVDAETRGRLRVALDRCAPDERALIEALYFRGQTMHAFATDMGVHVSTVSRRHARALRRLSRWYREAER
jgi:RNA polymerase sigma factor FliA